MRPEKYYFHSNGTYSEEFPLKCTIGAPRFLTVERRILLYPYILHYKVEFFSHYAPAMTETAFFYRKSISLFWEFQIKASI